MKSLDSQSDLPPIPSPSPYGSNWGHKIADFVFLPDIYFILNAFRALECIKRYWETYVKSLHSQSDLPSDPPPPPPPPPYASNWGHKIADFVFLPHMASQH